MREDVAWHELPPRLVIPFGALHKVCLAKQMKARLYIFDGGQTVEIADMPMGRQIARVTSLHGDEYTAPELAAKWLVQHNYLTAADFEA